MEAAAVVAATKLHTLVKNAALAAFFIRIFLNF
jgi:hypothetical protein